MDGLEELNLHADFSDWSFMCGKGFGVTGRILTFITAGKSYKKHFTIMAMSGDGQDIMRGRICADHAQMN
jgi:hypothetical protein